VSQSPATTGTAARILFIDNLRTALVAIVIVHHIAVIYGGSGLFFYIEPQDGLTNKVLHIFTALNQAWFMGALFLVSGYLSPGSFDRKGLGPFLKDRLLRLGIPLVFFFFILNPLASLGMYQMPAGLSPFTAPFTWQDYPRLIGMGPLWFAAMLLIFDAGYAAWRWFTGHRTSPQGTGSGWPDRRATGVFIIVLALATYLIRVPIPIDDAVLGFPTLAYFPQYLGFFCIGIVAARGNWLRRMPGPAGTWGFVAAAAVTGALFPFAFIDFPALFGHGTWQSAVYALWSSTFAVGLFMGSIALFRRFADHQGKLARALSQDSYAVYFSHAPVLVLLALWIRPVNVEGLLKFALLTVIAVPVCFAVAYLIRKIPLVSKVL
jgi:peptidoglycan/LPS O-acetylase OafA/YrhL